MKPHLEVVHPRMRSEYLAYERSRLKRERNRKAALTIAGACFVTLLVLVAIATIWQGL